MADLKFLDKLSASFELLPGVGKKTAKRYAYYVVEKLSSSDVDSFAKALIDTKNSITKCSNCGMLSLSECCEICSDNSRNRSKIMVLKDTKDIIAVEKIGEYDGLYH
jgi:recombination protein RecR